MINNFEAQIRQIKADKCANLQVSEGMERARLTRAAERLTELAPQITQLLTYHNVPVLQIYNLETQFTGGKRGALPRDTIEEPKRTGKYSHVAEGWIINVAYRNDEWGEYVDHVTGITKDGNVFYAHDEKVSEKGFTDTAVTKSLLGRLAVRPTVQHRGPAILCRRFLGSVEAVHELDSESTARYLSALLPQDN